MTEELTEKQRYQREYYAKNRDKICQSKRSDYAKKRGTKRAAAKSNPATGGKRKPAGAVIPTPPAKATSPVKPVRQIPKKKRHLIEDMQLAKEMGITVEELLS